MTRPLLTLCAALALSVVALPARAIQFHFDSFNGMLENTTSLPTDQLTIALRLNCYMESRGLTRSPDCGQKLVPLKITGVQGNKIYFTVPATKLAGDTNFSWSKDIEVVIVLAHPHVPLPPKTDVRYEGNGCPDPNLNYFRIKRLGPLLQHQKVLKAMKSCLNGGRIVLVPSYF